MRDILVPNDLQEFTSFGSPIDLYGYLSKYRTAKYLLVVAGTGSVVVTMAGSKGVSRTLTLAAGEYEQGEFMSIVSVTGVTKIRVGWN